MTNCGLCDQAKADKRWSETVTKIGKQQRMTISTWWERTEKEKTSQLLPVFWSAIGRSDSRRLLEEASSVDVDDIGRRSGRVADQLMIREGKVRIDLATEKYRKLFQLTKPRRLSRNAKASWLCWGHFATLVPRASTNPWLVRKKKLFEPCPSRFFLRTCSSLTIADKTKLGHKNTKR